MNKNNNTYFLLCHLVLLLVSLTNGCHMSSGCYNSHSSCGDNSIHSSLYSVNCVVRAFEISSIVPQVIPQAPPGMLSVQFYSLSKISLGNTLLSYKMAYPPYISYKNDPDVLYTIIFINPDIAYQYYGTYKYVYLHSLKVNVPGANYNAGDTLAPYFPYHPLPGSMSNRNVFLLYKQHRRINVTSQIKLSVSSNTTRFNLQEFVNKFDLGDPLLGNYFLTTLEFCD